MNPNSSPDEVEKRIHQALRSLPDRIAPSALEGRVLAAIDAAATRPWWRQSWMHWPMALRAAFLAVSLGAAAVLIGLGMQAAQAFNLFDQTAEVSAKLASAHVLFSDLADAFGVVVRNIPSIWFYSALAGIASLYVALFGLGAAAYRTLFLDR